MTKPPSDYRWPVRPYKGFSNYGPEDVALFTGRDAEIAEFARLVARSDVRLLMLHGSSGCGKSSFLRAGVIPFLERRQSGFAFVKNPEDPAIVEDEPDAKAVFVRSTDKPLEALADAVFRLAEKGHRVESARGWDDVSLADAKRRCDSVEQFIALVAANPLELIESLKSLASELPVKLVLVIDQAEEVVSLRRAQRGDDDGARFFRFLNAFAETRWPLHLIISLRTEFYGVFLTHLRRRSRQGEVTVHDYFLDELDRGRLVDAVLRPTLTTPLPGAGVPRDFYQFSFDDGVAERIVDDLLEASQVRGLVSGTLPFLQVVCESLHKAATSGGQPWRIGHDNYKPGDALEVMSRYLDDILNDFLRPRFVTPVDLDVQRSRWKDVLAELVKTQANGSTTTEIKTSGQLREHAGQARVTEVDDMLAFLASEERSVLRRDRKPGAAPGSVITEYSLRHDALGLVLSAWRSERATYRHRLALSDAISHSMPSFKSLELQCEFDASGSGSIVRRWLGLTSRQTILDFRIPYGFFVESPGRAAIPPGGLATAIGPPTPSALPARFVNEGSQPDRTLGAIEVTGRLGPATGFVGFETRQLFERGFRMTRAAVADAYKDVDWTTEYVSVFVLFPTESLRISVRFPEAFALPGLEAGPVVFLGSSEITHEQEIVRIRPKFRLEGSLATVEVDGPVPGLQYGVYWNPPI